MHRVRVPSFRTVDFQRFTRQKMYIPAREDVHAAPPACTYRKNSKHSRRRRAYSRHREEPLRAHGAGVLR